MSDTNSDTNQVVKKRPEAEVAREWHQSIACRVARRRLRYAILTVCTALVGGALAYFQYYLYAFWALMVAAMFGIQFLDAHGHLQEVRRRPWHILVPRVFRPPAEAGAANAPATDPGKRQD